MRIALDHFVHDGEVKLVGTLQCLGIHCPTSGNEGSVDVRDAFERGLEGGDDFHILGGKRGIAREDDHAAAGQRPPNRLERLPAHYEWMSHRESFEPFEVCGKVPRQIVVSADDSILGHRGDDCEVQTATGALMCGWGS